MRWTALCKGGKARARPARAPASRIQSRCWGKRNRPITNLINDTRRDRPTLNLRAKTVRPTTAPCLFIALLSNTARERRPLVWSLAYPEPPALDVERVFYRSWAASRPHSVPFGAASPASLPRSLFHRVHRVHRGRNRRQTLPPSLNPPHSTRAPIDDTMTHACHGCRRPHEGLSRRHTPDGFGAS